MPWLDELKRLRVRVDHEGYGRQMAQVDDRRRRLERFAAQLAIDGLLNQMNVVLLDGGAQLIVTRSWQYDFDDDDADDADDVNDEIVYLLYWHDGEPVEIEARVGIDEDDSGYVIVDDIEVDLDGDDAAAIRSALLDAFREIADIAN